MRKFLFIFLLAVLHLSIQYAHCKKARFIYDGRLAQKTEVLDIEGVQYVPLKAVAALFRGKTQWFPVTGEVVMRVRNHKITFAIDSRTVRVDSRKMNLEAPATLIYNVTYVPVRFFLTPSFSKIVDCKIDWHSRQGVLNAEPRVQYLTPRILRRPDLTRIEIESGQEMSPKITKRGSNVYVEIPGLKTRKNRNLKIKDKVIRRIKIGSARNGAMLKITLARKTISYEWRLEDHPPRLVLDFYNPDFRKTAPETEFTELRLPVEKTVAIPRAPPPKPEVIVTAPTAKPPPPSRSPLHVKRIVIDAGHGGKDAGAIGRRGTKEKDINLLIAFQLARVLRIKGGYEVYLTRSDDRFIPLAERSLFANNHRADLFISIHCNASIKRNKGGFEIYYLSEKASDAQARATAEMENSVIALEGGSTEKKQKVFELLYSMARTEFMNQSSLLCNTVHKAVTKNLKVLTRGIKQANFYVLRGAQMPAVLIETGFLTYSPEEKKLRKKKFRAAFAESVYAGIREYEDQLAILHGKK